MSPRYDIPKAAPEPLRQVQLLINSVDIEHEDDWLADWLHDRRIEGAERQARALREALRALVRVNSGTPISEEALSTLNRAAARVTLRFDEHAGVHVHGGDVLDEITAIAVAALIDGTWFRLKACRNCRWCFYDYSPNRSATWCSMQICGNRAKVRSYRRRHKAAG